MSIPTAEPDPRPTPGEAPAAVGPDSSGQSRPAAAPVSGTRLRRLLPRHLFGGRARTGTVILVLLFVGLLTLYGQRVDHYDKIDKQNRPPSITLPVVTEPVQQNSPVTTVTSTPSSASAARPPQDSGSPASSSSSAPAGITPSAITPGPAPGEVPTTTVTVPPTS
ncbi:hypothetical protein [Williamsia sp. CHRR-6]|uniref:hypothetical protein n=1 Tax=Williamsia sp. CHRR-6 TaxID=2835871 RepID=UPI001BD9F658|nr:hypothetical protein [Williamsia sp. CHRR-6]MBT0565595.1 hypothetical protein [Williamsia sp. CHRR-6]